LSALLEKRANSVFAPRGGDEETSNNRLTSNFIISVCFALPWYQEIKV